MYLLYNVFLLYNVIFKLIYFTMKYIIHIHEIFYSICCIFLHICFNYLKQTNNIIDIRK